MLIVLLLLQIVPGTFIWTGQQQSCKGFAQKKMRVGASFRVAESGSDIFKQWHKDGLEEQVNMEENALIADTLRRFAQGGAYEVDRKAHLILRKEDS